MRPKVFAAFALLGAAALTSPAFAHDPASADTDNQNTPIVAAPEDDQAQTPDRVQGKVLAVDAAQGRILVATDAGVLALRADPDTIAALTPGDLVEVVMVDQDEGTSQPDLGDRA